MNDWPPEPSSAWDIIEYTGRTQFKRQRLRHLQRIRQIVDLVRRHDYVVLLGPAYSEKTRLLYDVEEQLRASELFTPVYANLWRARTDDEGTFFASLAQIICRSDLLAGLAYTDHAGAAEIDDALQFQAFWARFLERHDRHLVLLIDHLQVLPPDLTHRLLQVLRAVYMERREGSERQLDVVVAGSAALAELAHDSTSPFNMAHGVFQGPLSPEASRDLAAQNLSDGGVPYSSGAVDRCVFWAGGDSYLIPYLATLCREKIEGYRKRRITRSVVDQIAHEFTGGEPIDPLRAAIHAIEEDPDTVLDVVTLLREEGLPRNEAHQVILRTGLDRLQLSGAVVLTNESPGGVYRLKNEIYRRVLRRHFVPGRVARVLRMNGRWEEAIRYLATELERDHGNGFDLEESRTNFLEAIIQAIYAADSEDEAYQALLEGIHQGFHRAGVRIYRAYPGQGEMRLVKSDEVGAVEARREDGGGGGAGDGGSAIDLRDGAQPEVGTLRAGGFALRGEYGNRRLVVPLTPERRAIGMVTIERFSAETEPHIYPPDTFALVRFLRHASTALENVLMRSAIQEIGRAVLNASNATTNLQWVIKIVANATGGNAALLLILDGERGGLLRQAHAGDTSALQAGSDGFIGLDQEKHPAVVALRSTARGPERQATPGGLEVYLPLEAGGSRLGVLAVYYAGANGISIEDRKTLETFADQVAIAVYNMQLLRRTSEALQEKVRQVEAMQRRAEQDRDQVLQDVATVLVHRIGGSIGTIPTQLLAVGEALEADPGTGSQTRAAVGEALDEVHKSVHRLQELLPPLEELSDLASVEFHPLEVGGLIEEVVRGLPAHAGAIEISVRVEEDLIVEGNRALLGDALHSLLENGCEAMPRGGRLDVALANLRDGRARIRIADTGAGIARRYQDSLFKPGFSTKGRRDRRRPRGRGLFTCREIIRKHRGEITIESKEGHGTIVTITLPILGA